MRNKDENTDIAVVLELSSKAELLYVSWTPIEKRGYKLAEARMSNHGEILLLKSKNRPGGDESDVRFECKKSEDDFDAVEFNFVAESNHIVYAGSMLYWSASPWDKVMYTNLDSLKEGRHKVDSFDLHTYFGSSNIVNKS